MLSDKTLRLVVNRQWMDASFAAYVLGSPNVRRQIEASGTGSSGTMKNITQDEIRSLRVTLPGLDEQRRAVEQMESASSVIEAHRNDMGKLRMGKHGLMDDLLSGRVRVKAALAS